MKKSVSTLVVMLSFVCSSFGQHSKILLLDGYLHPAVGEDIPSAAVGIIDGKISLIKNSLAYSYEVKDWDTIIKLNGQHIYPSFVAPNTTLGITEIDAVRATRDFDEVGFFNPHVRSQIAFNLESIVLKTVRTNGVLIAQPCPRGGSISGASSVMFLDGWNWEDATILADDGIHLNWPSALKHNKDNWNLREKSDDYAKEKKQIYDFFEASKSSLDLKEVSDLRYAAMKDCFKGTKRVYIHADELQQLQDVIDFVQHFDLKFPVIVGGYDSYLLARKLKDAEIPVMLFRTHSLPSREDDPIDLPFKIASKLQEEGVLFCIQNEGDMEAMNARNLPFLAGTCRAYGLTTEQAIAAISINACKIIGIEKNYGSVEIGKSATLFVSEGDALDMRSNNVVMALVNGKFMSLENHQTELYETYSKKYKLNPNGH